MSLMGTKGCMYTGYIYTTAIAVINTTAIAVINNKVQYMLIKVTQFKKKLRFESAFYCCIKNISNWTNKNNLKISITRKQKGY